MLKTNVLDMSGKVVGEIELSEAVFGIEPNAAVVHDVVKNHLANCRQGTQSALTRAEVSGGGPVHRHAGSMGASSHQSRIFPGKIGAGQMGNEQVTIENLEIVKVDAELNMIVIRGAIPGPKGGLVYIRNTVKNVKAKGADAGISKNPQKASGRNPQKASARG